MQPNIAAVPKVNVAPVALKDSPVAFFHCKFICTSTMPVVRANLRPRDILTRKAFENAATVVAASGGSTNAGLHLPALASECGIDFDLHDVAEIFKKTPYIADLKPGGRYVARDMFEIGGVPVLMKTLLDGGFLMIFWTWRRVFKVRLKVFFR